MRGEDSFEEGEERRTRHKTRVALRSRESNANGRFSSRRRRTENSRGRERVDRFVLNAFLGKKMVIKLDRTNVRKLIVNPVDVGCNFTALIVKKE